MLHVGADGCVHPVFTHDPSTLCLRIKHPGLTTIPPRLRTIFRAPAGHVFWSVRYVDLETALVGHFTKKSTCSVQAWHKRVTGLDDTGNYTEQEGAHQRGWLRSPFGNVHRFFDVLSYVKSPKGWELHYGPDAKRAVAFLPQTCARTMVTRAAQRLSVEAQNTLRLLTNDGMLGLCEERHVAWCLLRATEEMERPVPELGGLVVQTVATTGPSWGEMT
mgnify:CR=1 FL=1